MNCIILYYFQIKVTWEKHATKEKVANSADMHGPASGCWV